ncbi:MAG: diacylglycerol kinase family lipid kinase [Gemmatimonadales bacterium]|nr:diacylglycerol kinase family lipid kinase [Gemmatimonadales bacterium]
MSRVLLIANPVAARTRDHVRMRVAEALARAGWRTEIAITTGPADAKVFAREAVAAGVDVVAVFGGDGTSMQAVASIVGTDVALGLIPGGTGNLLAGNLGVPSNPLRAVRAITHGRRRKIDLGRVALPDGAHYFGVACGAGIDAHIMGQTTAVHKRRFGMTAYWATTFRSLPLLKSTPVTVTVDGRRADVRATIVLIMNCREMIPGLVPIRPDIHPDDGILDLITVAADTPWQGVRALARAIANGRRSVIRSYPELYYDRGTRFTVEPAEALPVQFDGDPVGTTPFTAEVLPGALTVMVPRE